MRKKPAKRPTPTSFTIPDPPPEPAPDHPDLSHQWRAVAVGISDTQNTIQEEWETATKAPFPGWDREGLLYAASVAGLPADAVDTRSCFVIYGKAIAKLRRRLTIQRDERDDRTLRLVPKVQEPPSPPVFLGQGRYQLGSGEVIALDGNKADVLDALVDLRACTFPDLQKKSNVGNPTAVLKTICERYPALSAHIKLPGGKSRGGFSTAITRTERK